VGPAVISHEVLRSLCSLVAARESQLDWLLRHQSRSLDRYVNVLAKDLPGVTAAVRQVADDLQFDEEQRRALVEGILSDIRDMFARAQAVVSPGIGPDKLVQELARRQAAVESLQGKIDKYSLELGALEARAKKAEAQLEQLPNLLAGANLLVRCYICDEAINSPVEREYFHAMIERGADLKFRHLECEE
jgi:hypothetical protein